MNFDGSKLATTKKPRNGVAAEINQLHKACYEGLRTTWQTAVQIGKLLSAQKAKLFHGEWAAWVGANLAFGPEQARRYMRCFENRGTLKANPTSKLDLTIEGAANVMSRN
jgi:hypothetical protein